MYYVAQYVTTTLVLPKAYETTTWAAIVLTTSDGGKIVDPLGKDHFKNCDNQSHSTLDAVNFPFRIEDMQFEGKLLHKVYGTSPARVNLQIPPNTDKIRLMFLTNNVEMASSKYYRLLLVTHEGQFTVKFTVLKSFVQLQEKLEAEDERMEIWLTMAGIRMALANLWEEPISHESHIICTEDPPEGAYSFYENPSYMLQQQVSIFKWMTERNITENDCQNIENLTATRLNYLRALPETPTMTDEERSRRSFEENWDGERVEEVPEFVYQEL